MRLNVFALLLIGLIQLSNKTENIKSFFYFKTENIVTPQNNYYNPLIINQGSQ